MPEPTPSVHVRDAEPGDAALIADFNARLALETEDRQLDPTTVRAGVEATLARPELGRYFIAEVEDEVVGQTLITSEWSDWRDGMFWWIQSVYVPADARRRGVFRALYEHVQRLARADPDVCGLRLYVERDNTRAMVTYERMGMTLTPYQIYEVDWPLDEANPED